MEKDLLQYEDLLLFDGVCNFCESTVQFVIRHERNQKLKFASLQSETGKLVLKKFELDPVKIDSVVLIRKGRAFVKSGAGLRLSRYLKGMYPLLLVFLAVPPFVRNAVYDWIARNRYKWFGKKETCMIPSPELRVRFVDL